MRYWLKSPMTWIFLTINSLLVFGAMCTDNIQIGGGMGSEHKNSPFSIQLIYGTMCLVSLLMITAFMNATANRDFQFGMQQFVFSSPIKKRDYFFGKFIGACLIAIIPLFGVTIGTLIAPLVAPAFDWSPAERYGEVIWSGHLMGILTFAIPNVFIIGVMVFSLAIYFRSSIVSFIGSMMILVLYSVTSGFTRDIEKQWLANLLDPFGFRPLGIVSKYMTVDEKNAHAVALEGALLTNRLVWVGIAFLILVIVYARFSFNTKNEKHKKPKKIKSESPAILTDKIYTARKANVFSFSIFIHLVKFEMLAVIRNPTFIIITSIGLINLIASITSFTGSYGSDQYPVTDDMISSIKGAFYMFLLGFIIFYSGVLVWKERDAKINEIQDATPIKTGMLFASKALAMIFATALILSLTIFVGIIAQSLYGYHRYQVDVYIESILGISLSFFSFAIILALLFHYLINNRYIAYFAFVVFLILNTFIWSGFDVSTYLVQFGQSENVQYSDMNGFGPFVSGQVWFTLYWSLFCIILSFVTNAFYARGKEERFGARWKRAKVQLGRSKIAIFVSVLAFFICGGFIFYNTNVLNRYTTSDQQEDMQVQYEKLYKKYETVTQPRWTALDYKIDLDPAHRNLSATITAWAKNTSAQPIGELHFTMPSSSDSVEVVIPGARQKLRDNDHFYRIYALAKPLQPNDSLKVVVNYKNFTRGFENDISFLSVTENGSFFNNADIFPNFGYNSDYEISDRNKRKELKLPLRKRMAKLNDNDVATRKNTYISNDSDWVSVTTTMSTSPDQIAIAPGSLLKSWEADGKKYFQYRLDQKSLNFYSFLSARYEVARKKWNGIDLEVYYDKNHAYNVPNMMSAMQKSLEYYTKNFGPYYHKQCRIIEFPRYQSFAQAFPGTMPFSEGIGFILDLRDVTKDDIDQVYYVVAHEMAHQYWAHQVIGPPMQGSEMMSEGFAQYSALMVMEKEYGKDKMKKFLSYEMDNYLNARSNEPEAERPLMKTENQQYIHYNKASVVMYYLKEMIGEDKTNLALRNLVGKYAYKNPPYATSNEAVREFKKVTPDSLQYLINDMFEKITLFDNRMSEAKFQKKGKDFVVTLKTQSQKFRADSLGKETKIPIKDYIDIAVFAKPTDDEETGKILIKRRLKITKKDNTFSFIVKEQPYNAGIDPYNYLIDRLPNDNLRKFEE